MVRGAVAVTRAQSRGRDGQVWSPSQGLGDGVKCFAAVLSPSPQVTAFMVSVGSPACRAELSEFLKVPLKPERSPWAGQVLAGFGNTASGCQPRPDRSQARPDPARSPVSGEGSASAPRPRSRPR